MANELKIRNGLQINETQIVSGVTNNSTLIADAFNIPTAGAVKGYADSISTALSSALSSEISTRGSYDTSLSTAISGEVSTRGSHDTSLSTAISGEIVTRGSADTSLSTAVSQRVSVDTSLSTALNGKLSISGGTVMSTFYLNGLTSSAVAADVLYYDIATSGITHGAKPTSSGGGTGYQTTGSTVFTYIGGTGTTSSSSWSQITYTLPTIPTDGTVKLYIKVASGTGHYILVSNITLTSS